MYSVDTCTLGKSRLGETSHGVHPGQKEIYFHNIMHGSTNRDKELVRYKYLGGDSGKCLAKYIRSYRAATSRKDVHRLKRREFAQKLTNPEEEYSLMMVWVSLQMMQGLIGLQWFGPPLLSSFK